jgi:hypothetical protein
MTGPASEDEAAAIAAAIARFEAETLRPPADEATLSPWRRAALLEGVGGKGEVEDRGGSKWLL